MSLSSAMNSAVSGLTATARATEVVSENVANSGTDGYARRSLNTSAAANGSQGVRINGVTRHVDPALLSNRREAEANHTGAQELADFHAKLEGLLGLPGDAGSIDTRLADFESSLISAASRPDLTQRLEASVTSAKVLASGLDQASDGVAEMRSAADRDINAQVGRLNSALEEVETLNKSITALQAGGAPAEGMMDQRQRLVDEINRMIPVNVVARPNNQVALFTNGGAALLDGRAADLSFSPAAMVTPDMSLAAGTLSGLTINGINIPTGSASKHLDGGRLGAKFQIRDELGVAAHAKLDQVATDLIQRFETAGLDPTLAAGDPGLFTRPVSQ